MDEKPPGNPGRHEERPSQIARPHVAGLGTENEG
jgi:hypothetical protein